MLNFRQGLGTMAGLGLLFGVGGTVTTPTASASTPLTSIVLASPIAPESAMAMLHNSPSAQEFQRIEQTLGVKLGVTAVGISLIGLELWWFLGSKPKSQKARSSQQGIQEVDIAVDGGYDPNHIIVQAGQPVRLTFLRKDPSSCLEQVFIPDFQIAKDLPLNQRIAIEFTPQQPGHYDFTCGMKMFRGVIQVVQSERRSRPLQAPTPNSTTSWNQ